MFGVRGNVNLGAKVSGLRSGNAASELTAGLGELGQSLGNLLHD